MGWKGGSKSETTIPDPTDQERSIMDMLSGSLLPGYMEEAGYVTTPTRIENWEDSPAFKNLAAKEKLILDDQSRVYQEITALRAQFQGRDPTPDEMARLQDLDRQDREVAERWGRLRSDRAEAENQFHPYYEYDSRKKESEEIEQIIEKHGGWETAKDTEEYKAAHEKFVSEKVETEQKTKDIQTAFQDAALKYARGDYSITPEQQQLIESNMAPIREAMEGMFKDTEEETRKTFKDYKEIVTKTGADMEEVLRTTVATQKQLLQMGIEDETNEISKKVAENAISLGRQPDDPEYQNMVAETVSREVSRGNLQLDAQQNEKLMAIMERTGGKLEAATMGEGQAVTELMRSRGAARTDLAEKTAEQQWNVGAGMAPSQVQTGIGAAQYNAAVARERLANAGSAFGAGMDFAGYGQRERMAQPTTTTSQPAWQQWLEGGLGVVGAASNIYSGVSVANALTRRPPPSQPAGGAGQYDYSEYEYGGQSNVDPYGFRTR